MTLRNGLFSKCFRPGAAVMRAPRCEVVRPGHWSAPGALAATSFETLTCSGRLAA